MRIGVIVAVLAYGTGVVGANVLSSQWPAVEVLALDVPAGTFLAGLTLTLRDIVHHYAGSRIAAVTVLVGAGLAWLLASPQIAAASAAAFVVSELVDAAIYATLRTRSWLLAVGVSNPVGLVVDSCLFVPLAFGDLAMVPGQIVAKTIATVASLCLLAATHRTGARSR